MDNIYSNCYTKSTGSNPCRRIKPAKYEIIGKRNKEKKITAYITILGLTFCFFVFLISKIMLLEFLNENYFLIKLIEKNRNTEIDDPLISKDEIIYYNNLAKNGSENFIINLPDKYQIILSASKNFPYTCKLARYIAESDLIKFPNPLIFHEFTSNVPLDLHARNAVAAKFKNCKIKISEDGYWLKTRLIKSYFGAHYNSLTNEVTMVGQNFARSEFVNCTPEYTLEVAVCDREYHTVFSCITEENKILVANEFNISTFIPYTILDYNKSTVFYYEGKKLYRHPAMFYSVENMKKQFVNFVRSYIFDKFKYNRTYFEHYPVGGNYKIFCF